MNKAMIRICASCSVVSFYRNVVEVYPSGLIGARICRPKIRYNYHHHFLVAIDVRRIYL